MTSIVVPAHNEADVLGRLLDGLLRQAQPGELEVVVVCNGCTDATADVARAHPGVCVVETPVASKHQALRLGDAACSSFPRLYVDADVEFDVDAVRLVTAALGPEVLAAAPHRRLVLEGRPWVVRAYYRVWEQLPTVRAGLFGRGVIAFTEEGHDRARRLPSVTADDLWLHHAFSQHETRIVPEARVSVHTPRRLADLLRRRLRVVNGVREVKTSTGSSPGTSGTSTVDLARLAASRPDLLPAVAVFLAVTLMARAGSWRATRRGEGAVWHRDTSSRA